MCFTFLCAGEGGWGGGGGRVDDLTNVNEISICFPSPNRTSIYLIFALSYTTIQKYRLNILVV